MLDYLVVGSGPSGIAAARRLAGLRACVIDGGSDESSAFPHASLQAALAAGDSRALLGDEFQMLANIADGKRHHPKLRALQVRYVAEGEPFDVVDGNGAVILSGAGSYAVGGMSNAWGAQLLRYTDADLTAAGNWPLMASQLESYYSDLEAHIGISGCDDDMAEYLGSQRLATPPVELVPAAARLLASYECSRLSRKASSFPLMLGRARLGVDTGTGSDAHSLGETEFLTTGQRGLYTAKRTLKMLSDSGKVEYRSGLRLETFRESENCVTVSVFNKKKGTRHAFDVRHLLLACGTMHTTKLVLLNRRNGDAMLPFLDHPPTLLPLFLPRLFGTNIPAKSFPVQLVGTFSRSRDMLSFYYPGGLLWSDLLLDMPFPILHSMRILRNIIGGMLVAQIWQVSRPEISNGFSLDDTGRIRVRYSSVQRYERVGALTRALTSLGAYTLGRLASAPTPGWGFHYAGTLPMRTRPTKFETHVDGRLWDSKRVRVLDASVFPSLPAKNHSLTMMANAARIADEVIRCGY